MSRDALAFVSVLDWLADLEQFNPAEPIDSDQSAEEIPEITASIGH